jgi:SAM-dependent methyltransferase
MQSAAARTQAMKQTWEESFEAQVAHQAYNTAPVEALVRSLSYYFRDRFADGEYKHLDFLELGCGAGPNLIWLAQKGMTVSGVDIAPTALRLARQSLERAGCGDRIGRLVEASVVDSPFPDASFDGIVEACVFQHLNREEREKAFAEVRRLLRPGGVFVGYMLDAGHTVFQAQQAEQLPEDPGTLMLSDGSSKFHLTNIGLSHFFRKAEFDQLLAGFSTIDPCLSTYYLPRREAAKRGYSEYLQSMWIVYAVK